MPSPNPLAEISGLIQEYGSLSFMEQRKRLRESRLKWIEENECPTSYSVNTTDKDGNQQPFSTPFQVGKIQYPENYNEGWKKGAKHEDPRAEAELLDGIDAILKKGETSNEKTLTVLVAGESQVAFFTGGEAEKSPYPAIEEGEDYGGYYARVAGAYEREAGTAAIRRPVPSDDSLRESTAADSSGIGRNDVPGDSDGEPLGPTVGGNAEEMCASATEPTTTDTARRAASDDDAPGAGASTTSE